MGTDSKTTVTGVEMFRKLLDEGRRVIMPVFFTWVDKEAQVGAWASAWVDAPHTKFKASVYVEKEEGGRHTPFFNGYRPQFYFRTTDVTGVVTLHQGLKWSWG